MKARKEIVLSYVEGFNAGDATKLRELFTPDAVVHGVTGSAPFEQALRIWHDLRHGLDATLTVEDMMAEGDGIAVRLTERGRWIGPFLGRDGATGKSYEVAAMEWFLFSGNRIRERWGVRDSAAIGRQIGLSL